MKTDTRQILIETVYDLTAELGVENVTVRKICERAGVNSQSVYYYFGNKEGLFKEAFSSLYREIDAEMLQKLGGSALKNACFADSAMAFWEVFLEYMAARPHKALFYNRYRNSNYINDDIWLAQKDSLVFFNEVFGTYMRDVFESVNKDAYFVIWSVILDTAIMLALRSAKTGEPVTDQMKRSIHVFLGSLKGYIK